MYIMYAILPGNALSFSFTNEHSSWAPKCRCTLTPTTVPGTKVGNVCDWLDREKHWHFENFFWQNVPFIYFLEKAPILDAFVLNFFALTVPSEEKKVYRKVLFPVDVFDVPKYHMIWGRQNVVWKVWVSWRRSFSNFRWSQGQRKKNSWM